MCFLIKDDNCLRNIIKYYIWSKVSKSIRKRYDSKPVYNEKYLEFKTEFYEDKIDTDFYDNGMSKEDSHLICLSVEFVDYVFKMYCLQVLF